jgi:hypothetical protein
MKVKISVLLWGMWAAASSALHLSTHSRGQRYALRPARVARDTTCGLFDDLRLCPVSGIISRDVDGVI